MAKITIEINQLAKGVGISCADDTTVIPMTSGINVDGDKDTEPLALAIALTLAEVYKKTLKSGVDSAVSKVIGELMESSNE